MWPWPDFNDVTQGQISDIPLRPKQFLSETFFLKMLCWKNIYFGVTFKIRHPVCVYIHTHTHTHTQGVWDHLYTPFISKTEHLKKNV